MIQLAMLLAEAGSTMPSQDTDGITQSTDKAAPRNEEERPFSEILSSLKSELPAPREGFIAAVTKDNPSLITTSRAPEETPEKTPAQSSSVNRPDIFKPESQTTTDLYTLYGLTDAQLYATEQQSYFPLLETPEQVSNFLVIQNISAPKRNNETALLRSEVSPMLSVKESVFFGTPASFSQTIANVQSLPENLQGISMTASLPQDTGASFIPQSYVDDLVEGYELTRLTLDRQSFSAPAVVDSSYSVTPLSNNTQSSALPDLSFVTIPETTLGQPAPMQTTQLQSVTLMSAAQIPALTAQSAVQQVAGALASISANGERMEIMLDPPELGRVFIDFNFDSSRTVNAVISADQPDTANLMKRNLDTLMQELTNAGFEDVQLAFSDTSERSFEQEARDETRNLIMETAINDTGVAPKISPTQQYLNNEGLDLIL